MAEAMALYMTPVTNTMYVAFSSAINQCTYIHGTAHSQTMCEDVYAGQNLKTRSF